MGKCKVGYALSEDGTIPQRCNVDWGDDFYPTVCKECPFYNGEHEEVVMNDVIKNLYTLFDAAFEENMNGRGTDITRMVTTFIPDAIQNLQAYEAMFNNKERPYDHVWDMYLDEFEDVNT